MFHLVIIVTYLLVVEVCIVLAPPPLKLTIDCESEEGDSSSFETHFNHKNSHLGKTNSFNVESFCQLIQKAIPKAVKDGKFVYLKTEPDQEGFSDTQAPVTIPPPKGFSLRDFRLPQVNLPKLKTPRMKVPKLRRTGFESLKAPRLGRPISFSIYRDREEETSAEKMERFKKGVQKMLHVVKVLGQVDQYLSERTRIIVEKIAQTLSD